MDLIQVNSLGTLEPAGTETSEESETEQIYLEEEIHNLLVRRNFHATPKIAKIDQRENIFQTKCRINGSLCDLIIDSGSDSNCVSKDLVTQLHLETTPHPHPYKLRWLDEQTANYVKRQCLVNFKIGTYEDQVLCDVLNMDACHVLLGRLWQHDKKTKHDGWRNVHSLKHEGKTKELLPLPPHKAVPPPKTRATLQLMSRKKCEKETKLGLGLFVQFTKEVQPTTKQIHQRLLRLLEEFSDIFPTELPEGLLPIRGIEH